MPVYAPLATTLTQIRTTLSREALLALMSHPGEPARAAGATGDLAPVHTALLWDQAGKPESTWAVAQRWDIDTLAATPLARAALASLQSRLAYWAGDMTRAIALALDAASAYRQAGHAGPAALADDWAARARWRRSHSSPPRTAESPE